MTAEAAWASVLAPSIDQRRAVLIEGPTDGPTEGPAEGLAEGLAERSARVDTGPVNAGAGVVPPAVLPDDL
jgi:hypothetical protein